MDKPHLQKIPPWLPATVLGAALLAAAALAAAPLQLDLELIASGLPDPVGIASAGGSDTRLFVLEQAGRIRIVEADGTVRVTPFLDISGRVDSSSGEEGLLGLTFHPDYAANGFFYVNYTHTTGGTRRSRISRFTVTADPNLADPNSEDILFTVVQPAANHNAGRILFGPDGYLYIPLGDGGGGNDPGNNAQTLTTLLGKIVRIDVDEGPGSAPDCVGLGNGNYTIPSTNPLLDGAGETCDEIWAVGLRNPWQSSFDRLTGDLFLADVGQAAWEEIDFQPAASTGGENYGWRCYEGNHQGAAFNPAQCTATYTFPIFEYSHSEGCSVTGGYVYRGLRYPMMEGHYLLADYCSGNFWDLVPDGVGGWNATQHTHLQAFGYTAFGEGNDGELYVTRSNGNLYHVVERTVSRIFADGFESGDVSRWSSSLGGP